MRGGGLFTDFRTAASTLPVDVRYNGCGGGYGGGGGGGGNGRPAGGWASGPGRDDCRERHSNSDRPGSGSCRRGNEGESGPDQQTKAKRKHIRSNEGASGPDLHMKQASSPVGGGSGGGDLHSTTEGAMQVSFLLLYWDLCFPFNPRRRLILFLSVQIGTFVRIGRYPRLSYLVRQNRGPWPPERVESD
jgi:hypothetical protein